MNKRTAIWLTIAGVLILSGFISAIIGIGWSNEEIKLRNRYEAQLDVNKAVKDKTWKVIKQKAGILDKYADDFKEAFNGIMSERYQGEITGAPMFKWIQEHQPNFSVEMYKDLADAIESNQAEFMEVQKVLRSIKQEHDNLIKTFPSKLVVGGRKSLEAIIITSTKTKKVFETGVDDDVELFDKEK